MWEEYCEEYKDQYRGENNSESDKSDLIRVDNIKVGDSVKSPLTVTGQARGTWFFEGSFPLVLVDWDGKIIAQGYAQFQGEEWMTTNFVPFRGVIEFIRPDTSVSNRGALILQKDNPSDQRELDDALEIPIVFE
jgi:hypothetical protein